MKIMGWGICFALDDNYNLYCADGCRWRTTDRDYEGFPEWPSARLQVLEYYERDAHSELDMIRDECPGTSAALKEACQEHMSSALGYYDDISDETKRAWHEKMVERISETDDALTEKFLNGEEISAEELKAALRKATITTKLIPVMTGTALRNKGVQLVLNAVVDYLPSPIDVPPMMGVNPKNDQEIERKPSDSEPFSALRSEEHTSELQSH